MIFAKSPRKRKRVSVSHGILCLASASLLAFLVPYAAFGQRERGELRIEVKDPQGRPAAAVAQLVSESNQLKREFPIAAEDKYIASELPFGVYRLTIAAEGFSDWTDLVEIRSE